MKDISLIGSGNVATHLGVALKKHGYVIRQVFSRDIENAKILAKKLDAKFTNKLSDLEDVYLIIIAIVDDAIPKVIKQIHAKNIIHTSGSTNLTIFKNKFQNFGVFYPLQTFNKDVEIHFSKTPICIEANNKMFEQSLKEIACCISDNVMFINSFQRKQLHIAAIFASNFSNQMFTIAEEILINSELEFSILLPLIKQTVKKLENNKPHKVQTGPAKRKDIALVKEHLKHIQDKNYKELYEKISNNILKINE